MQYLVFYQTFLFIFNYLIGFINKLKSSLDYFVDYKLFRRFYLYRAS